MRIFFSVLFILSFAFAEGQTGTITVRKDNCTCKPEDQVNPVKAFMTDSVVDQIFRSSGYLHGKVVSEKNGSPLAFAAVKLSISDSIIISTCTDIDGEFILKPVPEGKYQLQVYFCGYESLNIRGVIIAAGKTTYFENPPLGLFSVGDKQKRNKK